MHPQYAPAPSEQAQESTPNGRITPTIDLPSLEEVVLYGRNSTDEQKEACTIIPQLKAVRAYAHAHGYRICAEYCDEGYSGFTLERPDLDRLLREARAPHRPWHTLLVYDKSRLARRALLRGIVKEELSALGVTIVYLSEPLYGDSPEEQFAEGVTDLLPEYFATKLKHDLRRGFIDRLDAGKLWWCPYGYRLEECPGAPEGKTWYTVVIYESEAEVVREIYARIIAGESACSVARDLTKRRVPAPGARTKRWAGSTTWNDRTICNFIHSRFYVGRGFHKRTERVLPQARRRTTAAFLRQPKTARKVRPEKEWLDIAVPAIVTVPEQIRAKEMLAQGRKRSPRKAKHPYLLQTLFCCKTPRPDTGAACGRTLTGRAIAKVNGAYLYYDCSRPGCKTGIPAAGIEAAVWAHVVRFLEREDELRAAFDELRGKPDAERARLEHHLLRLDEKQTSQRYHLRRAREMREAEEYTAREFAERKSEIEADLGAVQAEIREAMAALERLRDSQALWQSIQTFCAELAARARQYTGPEYFVQRRAVVQALVHSIDVYPDRIELVGKIGQLDGTVSQVKKRVGVRLSPSHGHGPVQNPRRERDAIGLECVDPGRGDEVLAIVQHSGAGKERRGVARRPAPAAPGRSMAARPVAG